MSRWKTLCALGLMFSAAGCAPDPDTAARSADTGAAPPVAAARTDSPAPTSAAAPIDAPVGEWRFYGGNAAAQRYSPLTQIHRGNAGDLRVAWRWHTANFGPRPEQRNEATPLMIDGVL
ncbi:MAG: hypothetical protein JXB36_08255, partial [Gammaproteobacteria bacterium]|nr:hypothetical protein [Gammaproteobacteria bacterium]